MGLFASLAVGFGHQPDITRYADTLAARLRLFERHWIAVNEEQSAAGGQRRGLSPVIGLGQTVAIVIDQEPAATDPARLRLDDGEGKKRGESGVGRASALA